MSLSDVDNSEARSCNHCCRGRAINITYSECLSVALAVQHAQRMRRIILSSVNIHLCFDFFYIFCETCFILSGIEGIMIKNV
jgi:hypothetical protein